MCKQNKNSDPYEFSLPDTRIFEGIDSLSVMPG